MCSRNEQIIKTEIHQKINSNGPYYPPPREICNVKTDMNEFPYRRYFRGKRDDMNPNVWEREAGYAKWLTTIDTKNPVNESLLMGNGCFQIPCTTVLPCNPSNLYQPSKNYCVYTSP